jgi:hypothetical protein
VTKKPIYRPTKLDEKVADARKEIQALKAPKPLTPDPRQTNLLSTLPAPPGPNPRNEIMASPQQTPTTTKPVTPSTPRVNGQTASDETHDSTKPAEKRSQGTIPTMPACMVYKAPDGRVVVSIHHPVDKTSISESAKGIGSAKGAMEDEGFILGTLSASGPEWLSALVPAGAELLGFCSIKGFPLPKR